VSETTPIPIPPLLPEGNAAAPEKVLRKLFLTLFLRGRSSRGLQKTGAPTSVGKKLRVVLILYGLFGLLALIFVHQSVFAMSVYLHGMSLMFLGMFVASSAGEVLFNKEEADILLHRPVTPKELLWAKIRVLVEVSLWIAGAFNLVGFFAGMFTPDGSWLFPLAHILSTTLQALFCTACVVLAYQLCLRWFGREKLEGLMTSAQVVVSIAAVLGGQIVPRVMFRMEGMVQFSVKSWWIGLLPPAWFAGLDDTVAGARSGSSAVLAAIGVAATALVLWAAFGKLAEDYEVGLQKLGETTSRPKTQRAGRRFLDRLVSLPPLSWWLRNPVERASFLLTAAYLVRDRDVKLRLYPGLAPMMVMPVIFLIQEHGRHDSGFGVAFAASYVGLVPMLAMSILQFSQQWQAADVFRMTPLPGPTPLCHGARRAVLLFLTFPLLVVFGLAAWLLHRDDPHILLLLLPGLVALPVYSLIPGLRGQGVPFSRPTEEAKSAGRGASMMLIMFISMALSGIALWAYLTGWFKWYLTGEVVVAAIAYVALRLSMANAPWPAME